MTTETASPPSPSPHRTRRLLAIAGAALFGILAALAALRVDALQRLDEAAIRAIGDARARLGERAAKLDRHLVDVTALGGEADMTLVGLLGVGYLLAAGRRGAALGAITASLGGFLVNLALKHSFARERPALFASAAGRPSSPSFPSGHAMATMAIFVSLAWLLTRDAPPRARRFALLSAAAGALLVALTRPLLGVHWPSDIVGGAALGLTLAVCGIEVARAMDDEA